MDERQSFGKGGAAFRPCQGGAILGLSPKVHCPFCLIMKANEAKRQRTEWEFLEFISVREETRTGNFGSALSGHLQVFTATGGIPDYCLCKIRTFLALLVCTVIRNKHKNRHYNEALSILRWYIIVCDIDARMRENAAARGSEVRRDVVI